MMQYYNYYIMNRSEGQEVNRSQIYQQRMKRFLGKIRSYQTDQLRKISEKSTDEIQYETNKIVSEGRNYDQESFNKRQKGLDVESKIKRSRKINETRLSKMKARFEMIEKVQNEVKSKLLQATSDQRVYTQLLHNLIMQSMIKMLEDTIEVKCLERDVELIQRLLPQCQSEFADQCETQTKLVLSHERLPETELGGVVLTSFKGKIVCNNTLRARLDYALQQSLPEVRSNLFTSASQGAKPAAPR